METMTEEEFQKWIVLHGGELGRAHNYRTNPARIDPQTGNQIPASREIESTTITAKDGSKLTVSRTPHSAGYGGSSDVPDYTVEAKVDATSKVNDRTPAQTRADEAVAAAQEAKNQQEIRDNNERSWNQQHPDEFGVALPETHLERATRIAKERDAQRQREATQAQIEASRASTEAARARIGQDEKELAARQADNAASRALEQRRIEETERQGAFTRNKPDFLSQADTKTPSISWYDPQTGEIKFAQNPNYDALKAQAEERRAEIATQIASRQITLQEGQQAYKQWFDTNVETPLKMAQEARAKAEEQRLALQAEEQRRQFAADFSLRRGQLGESAAQRATNAEISLLPYRAGPTESAEMSSAINSLAAGGKVNGPDASAGIHFTPEAFQFAAPDFAGIAKKAAAAALEGISSYKPSQQQFATADYSGVPQINLSGAPAPPSVGSIYQYPDPNQQQQQP